VGGLSAGDNSNQSADDSCDDDDSNSSYRRRMKSKRGIFPKSATGILKAWLFQNLAVRLLFSRAHTRVEPAREHREGLLAIAYTHALSGSKGSIPKRPMNQNGPR